MILILIYLLGLGMWSKIWSILENITYALEKKVDFALVGWIIL